MFDRFDPSEYEDEARERWGQTDAYRQSRERASNYGDAQWSQIKDEAEQIIDGFAQLMRDGEPATGDGARAVAERHRLHISRWFYDCSSRTHAGLAEMYVADERFAQTYERRAPGLAAYVHDAIIANAQQQPAVKP